MSIVLLCCRDKLKVSDGYLRNKSLEDRMSGIGCPE